MQDDTITGTPGERIRRLRERRGLTRAVLAGLCGRSPEWLKKIEGGERELHSIKLLVLLAQALRVPDISVLTGEAMPLPLSAWDRATHPAVEGVRAAMQAAVLATAVDDASGPDEVGRSVEAAWRRWHLSAHNRTETGEELPALIR